MQLRPEAIADHTAMTTLAVDGEWSGTSSLSTRGRPDGGRWTHHDVPVTTLDEVLGAAPVSFCAKVDVEGWEPQVVAGATRSLSWTEPWALMLEVLHVPRLFLAGLAQRFPLLALDLRTDRFVRLPGGNGMLLDDLLDSTWLHAQDCVVANEAAAATMTGAGPARP